MDYVNPNRVSLSIHCHVGPIAMVHDVAQKMFSKLGGDVCATNTLQEKLVPMICDNVSTTIP